MSLEESFRDLADPPYAQDEGQTMERRRGPGLDLVAIELLLDQAYQRGHADGWHERDEDATREWPEMRKSVVSQGAGRVLSLLAEVVRDLESIFTAEALPDDPERPPHEWVDDRAGRLAEVLETLRGEAKGLAQAFGYDLALGDQPPITLWREVVPGEGVPVEVRPNSEAEEEAARARNEQRMKPEVVHGPDWPSSGDDLARA